MSTYYDARKGTLGIWDSSKGVMNNARTLYSDQDVTPSHSPLYPRPEHFQTFHAIIMDAFKEYAKIAQNTLYLVKNEVDSIGNLAWVFGRKDKTGYQYQWSITDVAAAGCWNYSDAELSKAVTSGLKLLDEMN